MSKNNSEIIINKQQEDATNASSCVMRKCCACGKISDRNNFIRILREHNSGKYLINPNNKQFGRSIYLCKNESCLKTAIKKKRLKNLTDEQLELLKEITALKQK